MIEMVECACAIPTTMQGRVLEDVSRNIDAETIRQPVGVCAAIVPFNFPAMVPFWFLPFAIACGNTFVLKPSEQVPLTQQIAFEELDALGLPPGVVNLVNGGREVVEGILAHPGIDAVSFVGSAPVAKIVYEGAAKTGKRVQALGGAKNHMVVMPDAVIEETVSGIIGSAFGAAGQRCMAGIGRRHGRRRARPADAVAGRGDRGAVGRRRPRRVDRRRAGRVGAARDRITGWIERAVADGATLAVDGRDAGRRRRGLLVRRPDDPRRRRARRADRRRRRSSGRCSRSCGPTRSTTRSGSSTQPLRQRDVDLHRERRRRAAVSPRRRGRHGRREHRRRRAGRVLPVLGLEGQLPRRPARPRAGRRRVLHAQEDRHEPLLLERPGPRSYFVES